MKLWRHMCSAAALAALVALPGAAAGQNLTAAQVGQIISAAVQEANARGVAASIAVVDRVGNVLGVFQMNGAPARITISSQRGIVAGNGLENVQDTFANALGAAASPSSPLSSIAKAITGAYLSSNGNAFTTRTASQIVQEHFNPAETFAPSGPLFGVQFSQLPCSDLSVRQATNAAVTGEVSATVGPKRSPLGLSADPGGLPLYFGGALVGGIGIESNGLYTLDLLITDFDSDADEIVALAGQSGFEPPIDIRANRIFIEGKSIRYTDAKASALASNPASAPAFGTINGVLGNLTAVTGYFAGALIDGQTFGAIASGIAPDPGNVFDFVGRPIFVLFNDAGNARFPPIDSVFPTVANSGLTANDVTTIIGNALKVAFAARAQIRRPLGSHAQVTVSVVDLDGNILGIARTPDAPIFGTDVSLQKARTAALLSSTTAATYLGTFNSAVATAVGVAVGGNANGVVLADFVTNLQNFIGPTALADGTAFSDRSGGNLSRPYYPDGIDSAGPGPLSRPFAVWSPFNTGLQLDTVFDNIARHILFTDNINTLAGVDTGATCSAFATNGGGVITRISNGFQIFPGSVPIYRNDVLIGGIGVSGDGIDQDDMISFLGLNDGGVALNNGVGNAPIGIRADNLTPGGTRLRYVNCPYKPFNESTVRNACNGK